MARYLVVANQTLGGTELDAAIRERVARGDARFHVVVPMTEPEHEAIAWLPADPIFGIPAPTREAADAVEEARRRSEHRLERMLEKLADAGGQAEGEVGSPSPAQAVSDVLDREEFDEIIISMLPAGISRWLKMDLPSRVARMTETPVTTIEATE
jgi:hypothetical protein